MSKILMIHHFSEIGGAGRSLIQNAGILSQKHDVTLMLPAGSAILSLAEAEGLKILPYSGKAGTIEYYSGGPKLVSRTYMKQVINRIPFSRTVKEAVDKLAPDTVILNSLTLSWLIPKIRGAGVFCFVRETFPENGSGFMFGKYKRLLNKAEKVFFISEFDREKFSLKTAKSVVLKNSVPDSFFESLTKAEAFEKLGLKCEPEKFRVLFAGGNQEFKGSCVLARAQKLFNQNVQVLLCGETATEMEKTFGGGVFLGVVKDMRPVYAAADCLVFPSVMPHQARPVFEAGAFGLPVIISDFPETAEYVKNGVNGITVAPGSPEALSKAVNDLSADPEKARELGENNRALTIKNHSRAATENILLKEI